MQTPNLDRLLRSDDDFGEPTLVESRVYFAEGTPVRGVKPLAQPRALADVAAANPRALRVTNVIKPANSEVSLTGEIARIQLREVEHQLAEATPIPREVPVDVEYFGPTTPFVRIAPDTDWKDEIEAKEIEAKDQIEREVEAKHEPETTPEQEWAEFKAIGLGPKQQLSTRAAKLIVSTYRLLGFGVLTAIVIALVGYITITVFYMFSNSWLVPTIVSPTDENVVALQRELAVQQNERDRLADALADAERAMATEQAFQAKFLAAVESDLGDRRKALRRVRVLAGEASQTREAIKESNDAFGRESAARMNSQYNAGMIDRHAMLEGKHQLAQITSSNLSLAERQAVFETQAMELARQATALDALLADKDVPLSYDVLKIKRDFDASKLAVAKAAAAHTTLLAGIKRQDQIIEGIKGSAQLRALADHATVAVVPYANLAGIAPGTPLYACRLEMLWCRNVGSVLKVLPGEVQLRHPHRDNQMRGQMIELSLTDTTAGQDDVLFVGGKPLGL